MRQEEKHVTGATGHVEHSEDNDFVDYDDDFGDDFEDGNEAGIKVSSSEIEPVSSNLSRD